MKIEYFINEIKAMIFQKRQNLSLSNFYFIFLFDVNFNKFIIRLHFLIITFILAKF